MFDQPRFFELDMTVRAGDVTPQFFAATGVDTIEDLRLAEAHIVAAGYTFAAEVGLDRPPL